MKLDTGFELGQEVEHQQLKLRGFVRGVSRWENDSVLIAVEYVDRVGCAHTEWWREDDLEPWLPEYSST